MEPARRWLQTNLDPLKPLLEQTMRVIRSGSIDTRGLANVAYGAARCGRVEWQGSIFTVLAKAVKLSLGDFKPQDIANTAWAYAATVESDASLFLALARSAEQRIDLNSQDVANVAWAFATATQSDVPLLVVFVSTAEWLANDFSPQNIANTAWAYAIAIQPDAPLFASLAKVAEQRWGGLKSHSSANKAPLPQNIANTAWAYTIAS